MLEDGQLRTWRERMNFYDALTGAEGVENFKVERAWVEALDTPSIE